MDMTNIEKAREIQNESEGYVLMSKSGAALWAAKRMAEWKEQQMIEKACEWLKDQACYYHHWEVNGDTYEDEIVVDYEKMIEDFKKAMEE